MPKMPSYSPEFRLEAVRLLRSSDRSVPKLARELGVSPQTLRNWAIQFDVDQGKAEGLTTGEREELRRLRRENRVLTEERERLSRKWARMGRWRRVVRRDSALVVSVVMRVVRRRQLLRR